MTPRTTGGYPILYTLSTLFFLLAVCGLVTLIGTDVIHHLRFSGLHQWLDSLPLIMIGLSCITLNLAHGQSRANRAKGVFLGVAFLCWGGEQLAPPSPIATLLDEGAITIFVIDVSLIILDRLNRPDTIVSG